MKLHTVSKIIYYDKNKKMNFWRISVKFQLWVPLKCLELDQKDLTVSRLVAEYGSQYFSANGEVDLWLK